MSDQKYLFAPALYFKKAIEAAAVDFSELAAFSINEEGGKIAVAAHPEPGVEMDEEFWSEFSNHVLAQMV